MDDQEFQKQLAEHEKFRKEYAARAEAERQAGIAQYTAEHDAQWADAKREYDPNANYPTETLDNVGLNIAGQLPEAQPELAPMTDDDKALLDAVAKSGASIQALAELEQQLREKNTHETKEGMLYIPSPAKELTTWGLRGKSLRWSSDIQMIRYLKRIAWGAERAYRRPNRFGKGRPVQSAQEMQATIARLER